MDRAQDREGRAARQRGALTLKARLGILDVGFTVAGPDAVLAPIAGAYREFIEPSAPPVPRHEWTLEVSPDASGATVGSKRVELVRGFDPTAQVYQLFLDQLMGGIGSHALLHAAALADRSGRVVLLAAASGRGKTSLTLELVARGFGFLGDDYAPLDLSRAEIAPYPRAIGIVPGGRATLPPAFEEAARREGPRLLGKRLVHVSDVVGKGCLVREPRPVGHVLLLSADESGATLEETRLSVSALSSHAAELDPAFENAEGVQIVERGEGGGMTFWRLALSPTAGAANSLIDVLESDLVTCVEKEWDRAPGFEGRPAAVAISRRETAEMLGRELLNRRRGGRLLARYDGSLAGLFFDLAGALRGAACHRIRVGRLGETADLIGQLVRS